MSVIFSTETLLILKRYFHVIMGLYIGISRADVSN